MSLDINFFHYTNGLVDRDAFRANHDSLQRYIQKLMAQHEDRNLCRNYVGINSSGNFVTLFCLSSSLLTTHDLVQPEESYPDGIELPTIKIGRLVVDAQYRNQGIGELTLKKAISIFVEISKKIGVIGLTVDAKKESKDWYPKYGFKRLNNTVNSDYFPLILYTNTLKKQRPSLFADPI